MNNSLFPLTVFKMNYIDRINQEEKEKYQRLVSVILYEVPSECQQIILDHLKFLSVESVRGRSKIYDFLLWIKGYRKIKISVHEYTNGSPTCVASIAVKVGWLSWESFHGPDMFARAFIRAEYSKARDARLAAQDCKVWRTTTLQSSR